MSFISEQTSFRYNYVSKQKNMSWKSSEKNPIINIDLLILTIALWINLIIYILAIVIVETLISHSFMFIIINAKSLKCIIWTYIVFHYLWTECSRKDGWLMTQQHHCIKIEDEGKTWNKAREYCEKSNADLVMLDDDSEREFLRNLRQAIYHFPLILLTGEQFSYQTNNSP